jgi:hypothetical protein
MRSQDTESQQLQYKLDKDLASSVKTMTKEEARLLVDAYYTQQDNRLRHDGKIRSKSLDDQPHGVLSWASERAGLLEGQLAIALKYFAESQHMGRWAMDVCGIGPVIAAGLVAHIDTDPPRCTAGHVWAFAGLDPSKKWNKGEKRPWNAALKVLAYKAGESFVKNQNRESCFYGKLFAERKAQEWENNLLGKFSDQATAAISAKNFQKGTTAELFYSGKLSPKAVRKMLDKGPIPEKIKATKVGDEIPMLPPAHIHARARRYAVKLFLAHWFEEAYRHHFKKEPPSPYPIAHLGHAHVISARTAE